MSSNEEKLSQYWMDKSRKSLDAAEYELKRNNLDFCVNRLYYSVFYAFSAILILRNKNFKKHSTVRAALHKDFVKEGLIPVKYGKLYDALLRDREEADYVAFVKFDSEVVEKEMKQTKEFLMILNEILEKELNKNK